jgi:hypothetical protein
MSGRDERKSGIYPPECPQCHNCKEWNIGNNTWILTEKAMRKRGLKYPVINLAYSGSPRADKDCVTCIGYGRSVCRTKFGFDTKIYKAVMKAFHANHGKLYHKSSNMRSVISDEW